MINIQMSEAIGLIYDAASAPSSWRCALNAVAALLNAHCCQIVYWNNSAQSVASRQCSCCNASEPEHFAFPEMQEPQLDRGVKAVKERSCDCIPFPGSCLTRDIVLSHATVSITAQRDRTQECFTEREAMLFYQLVAHFDRALRMRQLAVGNDARLIGLRHAVDQMGVGAGLLYPNGRIDTLNRTLEVLLQRGDGMKFAGDHLVVSDPSNRKEFHNAITEVASARNAGGEPRVICVVRASSVNPLVVRVIAVEGSDTMAPCREISRILIVVTDPDAIPVPSEEMLRSVFRLTGAEARLLTEIAQGMRLEEIVNMRGVRMPTLRTQLRSIFAKTQTQRQAELVRITCALSTAH